MNSPRPSSFDPSQVAADSLISLQSVQIATPCRADWSKMEGDDKSRFCQTCQKSVYNLSAMTTPEAQALIEQKQGDLCARIYRRADGTVITQDCPVGKAAARRPFWALGAGFVALLGLGSVLGIGTSNATSISAPQPQPAPPTRSWSDQMRALPMMSAIINTFSTPRQMGAIAIEPLMGDIAAPAPTTLPTKEPAGAPEMGEPVAYAVLGRMICPQPTATPKPAKTPDPNA